MPGMTSRPKSRSSSWQAACAACGLALGLAAAMMNAYASGAVASVGATVVAPASVNRFLGAPVTIQDLLAAWHAAAGPQTGAGPLRLPSLLPAQTAQEQRLLQLEDLRLDEATAWSEAQGARSAGGLLQAGLAAAISAVGEEEDDGHGALLFITVAFN